jgi:hypothetical protein
MKQWHLDMALLLKFETQNIEYPRSYDTVQIDGRKRFTKM